MWWANLLRSNFIVLLGLLFSHPIVSSRVSNSNQEPVTKGPTLKSETRIVLVDVVVTDAQGNLVSDLKPADFQLSEDGKPQNISGFDEHKSVQTPQPKLPPMPPDIYTNFATARTNDAVNILLLDLLNTEPSDQAIVREQVRRFLANVPPGTRMAVFALTTQLRLIRGFTTDFSNLTDALADKKLVAPTEVQRVMPTDAEKVSESRMVIQMIQSQASPVAVDALTQFLGDHSAQTEMGRSEVTLQAFQDLARYLSGIPARKNIIWLADSFPLSFFPDAKSSVSRNTEHVKRTSDMLTAAQIAVYPVSALGVVGDPTFDVSNLRPSRQQLLSQLANSEIAMETIAQQTGGRAFFSTNALTDAIQDAVQSGSHYYTLSYSPTNPTLDGKFRKIELRSGNSAWKLSYRRGYFADPAIKERDRDDPAKDPLLPLIGFGMPNFDQILYKVHVAPKSPQPPPNSRIAGANTKLKPPLVRFDVDFAVALQDLTFFQASDGVRNGQVEVMLVAFDQDGSIRNFVRKRSPIAMNPDVYSATVRVGMQVHEEIDLPAGETELRVGIYDFNSGKCGTLGIPVTASLQTAHAN